MHIHIHTKTYIHTHTYTYTYTDTHIHTFVRMYIHIYIHRYVHTYIYACMHMFKQNMTNQPMLLLMARKIQPDHAGIQNDRSEPVASSSCLFFTGCRIFIYFVLHCISRQSS